MYFDLAHHHYPSAAVDVLYVTPPMQAPYEPPAEWARYAHTTWAELADLISSSWAASELPGQQEVRDGLLATLGALAVPPSEWRATLLGTPEPVPGQAPEAQRSPLDTALAAATLTAGDGMQRAVEYGAGSLEDLLELRLAVRDALASSAADPALRHVRPWIWRPESTGQPLTAAGGEHGMELRLSRYTAPQY